MKQKLKTATALCAIAFAPVLSLLVVPMASAQPPSSPSSMAGSPVSQPTETPTAAPKSEVHSYAATSTRKYTRDPIIQVGEIHVEGNKTTVSPGESVLLWVDEPSDYDSWTTTDGQSGQEVDDTLFGKWSNGGTGYATTWVAPNTQGIYKPKFTVNDDINRGSTNGRNDLLIEVSTQITVKKVTATILNPSGDPTTAGTEGANEFTFDDENGYCYIRCEAKLTPNDADAEKWAEDHISWSIDGIEDSEIKWGEGGRSAFVEKDSKGKVAWLQLKGLPLKNSGFGPKTVTMNVDGVKKTTQIELFFSKYATNHPGSSQLSPYGTTPPGDRSPNWFYYWNQVVGDPNAFYDQGIFDYSGYTPALGKWSLSMRYSKTEIWLSPGSAERLIRPDRQFTGINNFANAVKHEKVHVKQIADADRLLTQTTGIWSKGWAWQFNGFNPDDTPDNRYNPGPPPKDLDEDDDVQHIPDAWGITDLEQEAKAAETIPDNDSATIKLDWSSPGKQYGDGAYTTPGPQ